MRTSVTTIRNEIDTLVLQTKNWELLTTVDFW
jgi:hypothetical protein